MNTKISKFIIVIVCVLAVAGGITLWRKNMLAPQGPAQGQNIYYCPMHPNYTSDRPGNCPICGMKLVKRESSRGQVSTRTAGVAAGDHAAVHLNSDQQQLLGVKLAPVVKKPFVKTIRAYGYVAHDLDLYEAQLEYIEAWRDYYAIRKYRPVRDEFREDWREYYRDPAAIARSEDFRKAQYRLVKAEYELRHMGFNDPDLEQLRLVKRGQPFVQPEILFIQEGHPLWVYAQIFEQDLGYVDVGQKATVEIPAYQESFEGIVRNVSGKIDPATRTAIVRIELPPSKRSWGYLKVNMYANVLMPVELNDVLMVPRDALMDTGARKLVFVRRGEGHFEPQEVKTGLQSDGMVEIKEGLTDGEMVVAGGSFLVDSESRLQAALAGMTAGAGSGGTMETEGGHSHGR